MSEIKMTARPWQPQDLLDDLQQMIDEQPDNYLNTERQTLCTAKAYLEEHFAESKHGRWVQYGELDEDGNGQYHCSVCSAGEKHNPIVDVPYCWKCGAKMDGDGNV